MFIHCLKAILTKYIIIKKYKFTITKNIMKEPQMDKNIQQALDQSLKSFFKFVHQIPQFQNAIFLFSKTQILNPKQFLNQYGFKQIKACDGVPVWFVQLQKQNTKQLTCIFNINYQFNGQKKKQKERQKTLILMYLLKKVKKCKILICLDEDCIQRTNSQQVTNSLSLIFEYFRTQQFKSLYKSVGILLKYDDQNGNLQKAKHLSQKFFDPILDQGDQIFKNNIEEMMSIIKQLKNNKKIFFYNFANDNNKSILKQQFKKSKLKEEVNGQKLKLQFQQFLQKITWFSPNKDIHLKFISQVTNHFSQLQYKNGQKGLLNIFYCFNEYFKQKIAVYVCKQLKQKNNNRRKIILNQDQNKNSLFNKYKTKNLLDEQKFSQLKFQNFEQKNQSKWTQINKLLIFFFDLFEKRQKEIEGLSDNQILQFRYRNFLKFIILLFKLGILNQVKILQELLNYKHVYDAFLLTKSQQQISNFKIDAIQQHSQNFQKIEIYQKIFFILIKQYLHSLQQQIYKVRKNFYKNFSIQVSKVQRILSYCKLPFFKEMKQLQLIPQRFEFKLVTAFKVFKIKQIECMEDGYQKLTNILNCQAFQNNQQNLLQIMGDSIVALNEQDQQQRKQIRAELNILAIQCYEISNTHSSINKISVVYQKYLLLDRIILFKNKQQYIQKCQIIKKYLQHLILIGKAQRARQVSQALFGLDQATFKRILLLCTQKLSGNVNLKFAKMLNQFNPKSKNINNLKEKIKATIQNIY